MTASVYPTSPVPDIRFFASADDLRRWLEAHYDRAEGIVLGFYKKAASRTSLTRLEALDQALCFGWTEGARLAIDAQRYAIRFAPRRRRSPWSPVHIERVAELIRLGLMRPPGIQAFDARRRRRRGV